MQQEEFFQPAIWLVWPVEYLVRRNHCMPSPTTGGGGEKNQLQWFWAMLVLQGQPATGGIFSTSHLVGVAG